MRITPASATARLSPARDVQSGWTYWRSVWVAWCPTCEQETMPFPSGQCAFCDTHLAGQPQRGPYDPPLTKDTLNAGVHRLPRPATRQILKAA